MNIRTTEQTKKEFDKKFLRWKIENEKGTQEQFLLHLLKSVNIKQTKANP